MRWLGATHDDVIKWKRFPRNWPFVMGINRSPMDSSHKGQRRGALLFSLICAWTNGWQSRRRWFETSSCSFWCHCSIYPNHYNKTWEWHTVLCLSVFWRKLKPRSGTVVFLYLCSSTFARSQHICCKHENTLHVICNQPWQKYNLPMRCIMEQCNCKTQCEGLFNFASSTSHIDPIQLFYLIYCTGTQHQTQLLMNYFIVFVVSITELTEQ